MFQGKTWRRYPGAEWYNVKRLDVSSNRNSSWETVKSLVGAQKCAVVPFGEIIPLARRGFRFEVGRVVEIFFGQVFEGVLEEVVF